MPHLSYLAAQMRIPSDGMVTVQSAFAEGLKIKTEQGADIVAEPQRPAIALDHMEQFYGNYFLNFLHKNKNVIKERQVQFYKDLSNKLKSD